jgi:hypothetical protein
MPADDSGDKTPVAPRRSSEKLVKRKESKVAFTADVTAVNVRDESVNDTEVLGGSVITVTAREVKRYRVPFSKSKPTPTSAESNVQTLSTDQASEKLPKHKVLTASRKPSLEWRRWLSNELNIFRFGSGSKEVENSKADSRKDSAATDVTSKPACEKLATTAASDDAVVFGKQPTPRNIPPIPAELIRSAEMLISPSNDTIKSNDERLPHSRTSSRPHIRSRATSRSSSSGYMNERYPMVISAIDIGTAASIAESRCRGPKKAASFAGRTISSEPAVPEDDLPDQDEAFIEMTENVEQAQAADALEVPSMTHDEPLRIVPSTEVSTTRPVPKYRTRSALELRAKYNAGAGQVSKALEIRKTRQGPTGHPALKKENSHTETVSQAGAKRTPVPQIDHVDYAPPGSPPPRHPLRLAEDPTLRDISAGPYADEGDSDGDVHAAGRVVNAQNEELDLEAAGAELMNEDLVEPIQGHSAAIADHASFRPKATASDRRRQAQRKPAPSGVKVSQSSLLPKGPKHPAQRQPTPIAASITLENSSNVAWLRSEASPAPSNPDIKTAPKAKFSIGENTRPSTQMQSTKPAMTKPSKEKLPSHSVEPSKDRKASRTRHHQPTTKTAPLGHA